MNCVRATIQAMRVGRDRPALWTIRDGVTTFEELARMTRAAQGELRRRGMRPGDAVLLLDLPGPRLFAVLAAASALGGKILFVEPWMPPAKIEHVLRLLPPRFFITPWLGRVWGARVAAIRRVPEVLSPAALVRASPSAELTVEEVDDDEPAIVTFSSGTTGHPKGVIRSHGYIRILEDLFRRFDLAEDPRPDLAVFPNVVLYQLGRGRCTVLVPPRWRVDDLARIAALPEGLQPETVSCGPAFLAHLLRGPRLPRLGWLGVGGALSDCAVLEGAFERYPEAAFLHIYGGTEVEPVAHADAREAVARSRARGLVQTLYVGHALDVLALDTRPEGLWVSGPNVCPEYLGAPDENLLHKRRDADGRLWHFMGDRVESAPDGLWLAGRSTQRASDFADEQAIFALIGNTSCFLHRTEGGRRALVGENVERDKALVYRRMPDLADVVDARIFRDRRHRARIDRARSLRSVARRLARLDA